MYGRIVKHILDYFRTVLDALKQLHATIKLKRCKRFKLSCKFVRLYVEAGGAQPAQSKNEAFADMEHPNTWGDFHMLIGILGSYKQLLTLHELDIRPCMCILFI